MDETSGVESEVQQWLDDIDAARRREKDYRKRGREVRDIYAGDKPGTLFNVVFSNTETMLPALYSQTPRPVVTRRFKDDDRIAQAAAKAGERMLAFLLKANGVAAGTTALPADSAALRRLVLEPVRPR